MKRLRDIQPLEAIPRHWREGEELSAEATGGKVSLEEVTELDECVADVESARAKISDEDHDKFMAILERLEAESKEF